MAMTELCCSAIGSWMSALAIEEKKAMNVPAECSAASRMRERKPRKGSQTASRSVLGVGGRLVGSGARKKIGVQ